MAAATNWAWLVSKVLSRADFVAWDISHPAELSYWIGANPARTIVRNGAATKGGRAA